MLVSTEYLPSQRIREKPIRRARADAVHENTAHETTAVHVEPDGEGISPGPHFSDADAGRFEVLRYLDGSNLARVSRGGASRMVRAPDPETAVEKYVSGQTCSL